MSITNTPVITRFAPSPTGYLHIGGARTALFNYLFAKHHNGLFRLRIEDTDQERSSPEAVEAILNSLKWLGLNWDDEIVYQAKNNERHKECALRLVEEGSAYYCFTPQAEIDALREQAVANKQHFIFNSPWRDASPSTYPKDIKPVVRLKAPRTGVTIIEDKLQGNVVIENSHLDDMVLLRSNGTATYMLAVVVDDYDMQITHIIRGDDHLTNAARQILLYKALGAAVPVMVHIPLIHGPDGAKLSKRHGALGVEEYRNMGYLSEALNNYLLRLGWGHGNDEIISKEQAIEWFDLGGLGKSSARLDFAKMKHVNAHYMRLRSDENLAGEVEYILFKDNNILNSEEKARILRGMSGLKQHAELVPDLADLSRIYLDEPIKFSEEARQVALNCNKELIEQVNEGLKKLEIFDKESIQTELKNIATSNNIKLGELMQPLRALMTGRVSSPSVFEIMAIMGKDNTIKRLKAGA